MPLLRGLPSGGGGTSVEGVGDRQLDNQNCAFILQPGEETSVESVGGRQLDSHVGFVLKPTVRLLVSLMSMSVGGSLL